MWNKITMLALFGGFALVSGCAPTCDDACNSLISCNTSSQIGFGPVFSGGPAESCITQCKNALAAQKIKNETIDCLAKADGQCSAISACK